MRKRATASIILALILTSILTYNTGILKAQGETIYIRPDGSIDPATAPIQRDGSIYTFTDNIYETIVVERDNIVVDGNDYTLQGAGDGTGLNLSNRNNVTVRKVQVTNFAYGIYLYKSNDNIVTENNLTGNVWRGISVSNSSSNTISKNLIVDNGQKGIFLWISNTTTIASNNVSNNLEDGISIGYSCFYNTIANNTVSSNSYAGIFMGFETPANMYNLITGNNITQNSWAGVDIDYHTSGNTFHHNNFNNTNQVISKESTNIWDDDYPSGGNYWSSYAGEDLDGDGIGDTPHIIDQNNQDDYPFMNPWTPQAIDIATANMTSSKTIVGQDHVLQINVTATNQGSYTQTFSVTAYANATSIETKTATLENGNSTIITFTWDTTTVPYGNYTISAYANPLPGEVDTADNTYKDATVLVTVPGDVNGDRIVDIFDIGTISAHWYPGPPAGPLGYDANCDINDDRTVDIFDIGTTSAH
jgi:parallel beta-helix repeat protein